MWISYKKSRKYKLEPVFGNYSRRLHQILMPYKHYRAAVKQEQKVAGENRWQIRDQQVLVNKPL